MEYELIWLIKHKLKSQSPPVKVRIEMILANIFCLTKHITHLKAKNMFQYYFERSLTDLLKLNTFHFVKFYHDIVQSFCNHSRKGGFQIGRFKGDYPF